MFPRKWVCNGSLLSFDSQSLFIRGDFPMFGCSEFSDPYGDHAISCVLHNQPRDALIYVAVQSRWGCLKRHLAWWPTNAVGLMLRHWVFGKDAAQDISTPYNRNYYIRWRRMDQPRSMTPTPGKLPCTMTGSHSRVLISSLWQWIPWGRHPKSLKVIRQLVKEWSVTLILSPVSDSEIKCK